MKYCFNCNRITPGEPLFCNFCGRTYDAKLCPHKHLNPRTASVCATCGSRDLTTPQPKMPLWTRFLEFILECIPALLLIAASCVVVLAIAYDMRQNPGRYISFVILLGILWWLWAQLPRWFRDAIYRLLKRRRERDDG